MSCGLKKKTAWVSVNLVASLLAQAALAQTGMSTGHAAPDAALRVAQVGGDRPEDPPGGPRASLEHQSTEMAAASDASAAQAASKKSAKAKAKGKAKAAPPGDN